MLYTRRDFGKVVLAAGAATGLGSTLFGGATRPNSKFGGVQIGAITYSFRALPGSAEETLKYCLDCGISAIELMSNVAESYAGAPAQGRGFVGPGRGPTRGPGAGEGRAPAGQGAPGQARGPRDAATDTRAAGRHAESRRGHEEVAPLGFHG